MDLRNSLLSAALIVVLAPAAALAGRPHDFQGLGLPSGYGAGISGDGLTLLGLLAIALAGPARAGVGFEGLGSLKGPDIFSEPYAVSASGSVIVGASRSEERAPLVEAFLWTPTGGTRALREMAPTMGRSSTACGVSADGCTVVGRASDSTLYGFRWNPIAGMVRLRDGEGSLWGTQAWGISANGAVTVGQVGEDEFARADEAQRRRALCTRPPLALDERRRTDALESRELREVQGRAIPAV